MENHENASELFKRINTLYDWQREQILISLLVDTVHYAREGDTRNLEYLKNEISEFEKQNKEES